MLCGVSLTGGGATEIIVMAHSENQRPPPLLAGQFGWLLAVQLAYGFVFSAFLLLPKYLVAVHDAGADVVGQVSGVSLFAAVATVPLASWLLSRVSRGALIVVGALLGGSASVAFACVTAVGPVMYGLRLAQGVAFVLVFNAGGTLVADLVPEERLGQALGVWGLAMLLTNAIAPAALEPLADQYGWNSVFYVAGIAGLIAAAMGVAVTLQGGAPGPRTAASGWGGRAGVFDRRRRGVFAATALMGAGLGTMFTFVPPFALDLGIERVSGFFLGYTAAAIAARVALGSLADRFGRARVSAIAMAFYAASVLATAWLTPALLAVVGAGIGLSHGIAYPAMNALAVEDAVSRQRGPVMAYYNGAFNVGFAVCVTTFGPVARIAGYPAIFVLAGLLVLAGAVAMVRLPVRTLHPGRELDQNPS